MKKLIFSIAGAALYCLVFFNLAYSGGNINHTVKIRNDTNEIHSAAWVYYGLGVDFGDYKSSYIGGPGSSHTFEFGSKCPKKIEVYIGGSNTKVTKCTSGMDGGCSHTCWSSSWKITGNETAGFKIEKD